MNLVLPGMRAAIDNSLLHIHCGDSSGGTLQKSEVPGKVLVWHDPVLEGPVPANVTDEKYREIRARFFCQKQYTKTYEDALAGLRSRHADLEKVSSYEEVVLWFDACLFDQTILIHLIDKLARIDTRNTTLSLICVGEHPAIDRFLGLGQLSVAQMADLFPTRHELSDDEIHLAVDAWRAFTSDDPGDIEKVIVGDCSVLPYLADAFGRHLEQYPSVRNGLSRLEREVLEVVMSGQHKLGGIFAGVSGMEDRPFFGDTTLWDCMDDLASCSEPFLRVDGPGPLKHPLWEPVSDIGRWTVDITQAGQDALAGNLDHVAVNGIDRWLGGVHLNANHIAWRWDETKGEIAVMTKSQGARS